MPENHRFGCGTGGHAARHDAHARDHALKSDERTRVKVTNARAERGAKKWAGAKNLLAPTRRDSIQRCGDNPARP
jgi:hypothetical protein